MSSDTNADGSVQALQERPVAIHVESLSKLYQIYEHPRDRLKQFVLPRVSGLMGRPRRNYFREYWALQDVSFDVRRGEAVASSVATARANRRSCSLSVER